MALVHPTHQKPSAARKDGTKHPGVCLAGFFVVIVGSALAVHMLFTALI